MRLLMERERRGWLVRLFGQDGEIAYLVLALRGLCAEIEFPSDWHEQRRAWVRLGFGLFKIAFSFPWRRVVPDDDELDLSRHVSHFSTCPQAGQHRRSGK